MVAGSKFLAAAWTGSVAMFAEAVDSVVDMTTEGLLLYGLRRSQLPPTTKRPFGYGRELYFWTKMLSHSSGWATFLGRVCTAATVIGLPRPGDDASFGHRSKKPPECIKATSSLSLGF